MRDQEQSCSPAPGSSADCLIERIDGLLAVEPAIAAVRIDRAVQSLALATLGVPDTRAAERNLSSQLLELEREEGNPHCGLLRGEAECRACHLAATLPSPPRVTVTRTGSLITIARATCPTAPTLYRWHDLSWPKFVARDADLLHEHPEDEWKAQFAAALLCGAFGLFGYWFQDSPVSVGLYLAAYLAGGWFAAEDAWHCLKERSIDIHFLMLAVAGGSAAIGFWGEGTILLFLFCFSGALEHYAMGRTQREIRALFKSAPKTATVINAAGRETELAVDLLRPGLRLLVKPGALFPVDAEIVKGKTAADEANLTGEAVPVEKEVGDTVLGGTLNLWGAVEAVALRPAGESALQKIVRLIEEAHQHKAPAQRFTDRFGSRYAYLVLSLSLLMFAVWWLGFEKPPFTSTLEEKSAFYRAMTLLVVASPCALVLSIPSAVLAAIAWGARRGVLFRGGAAVEKLAHTETVALDKTGTLTTGELKVELCESFPPGRESEVAQIAYSLERLSTHPLARAITRYGKQHRLDPLPLEQFESITGHGLRAEYQQRTYTLGRRSLLAADPHARIIAQVPAVEAGQSEVWLASHDLLGRIVLRDDIRPQAKFVVDALRAAGLKTVVLTGDRAATGEHLKSQLHLDDVRSELKPEDKVDAIRQLSAGGRHVAMIGDGVNDAPSLAAAYVGVAMGARGSDAALEQADVVLMHDRLENFLAAYELSQRARRIIRQNLFISLGTVLVLVAFALTGDIPLTLGVIGHEGSTVLVVTNSLRLLLGKALGGTPQS